jgi:hypothetical protein
MDEKREDCLICRGAKHLEKVDMPGVFDECVCKIRERSHQKIIEAGILREYICETPSSIFPNNQYFNDLLTKVSLVLSEGRLPRLNVFIIYGNPERDKCLSPIFKGAFQGGFEPKSIQFDNIIESYCRDQAIYSNLMATKVLAITLGYELLGTGNKIVIFQNFMNFRFDKGLFTVLTNSPPRDQIGRYGSILMANLDKFLFIEEEGRLCRN